MKKLLVKQEGQVIQLSLILAVVLAICGCVGYVDGGGGVAVVGPVIEPPDVVVFAGHEHGHYDRDYGRRGGWSRGHWRR